MKISKKTKDVKATVAEVSELIPLDEVEQVVAEDPAFTAGNYCVACECIEQAIEALADRAKEDDEVAREAIANLSVILFDLK